MSVLVQISAGTGHLIPDPERACSEQPVVNSSEQVTAETEQIQHEAVDREKSLCVRDGFEPTHLSLTARASASTPVHGVALRRSGQPSYAPQGHREPLQLCRESHRRTAQRQG